MSSLSFASETDLVSALRAGHSGAFTYLYDRYAPVLLGIINQTVDDEQRAEAILIETFAAIRSGIEHCPASQPLFVWLFDVARQTAANALATAPKAKPCAVQLTPSGRVVAETGQATPAQPPTDMRRRLLNAVLFDRCTLQEASHAAGLPTENARQHLRDAFLQLRGQGV